MPTTTRNHNKENERDFSSVSESTQAAARGTLRSLLLRIISFACTQWTIRVLDASTLGKANIQLELLLTTILFVSREGFRLSMTRNISTDNFNVAWLTIPLSTVVSSIALAWHLSRYSHSSSKTSNGDIIDQDFRTAGILYCFASWLESCAEPPVLFLLRKMDVSSRVSAESFATVGKTLTTVIGLKNLHLRSSYPVTAMGISQVAYSIIYFGLLYWKTWGQLPGPERKSPDGGTCKMTLVFTIQSLFKHLLTEADRIVLSTISSAYNQGVYAMGSAYGGMAARILLQPMEENARLLWSRLAQESSTSKLEDSYTILVKLVLYIGMLFSCVAVNYTHLVLNLLAGRKWGSNEEAISVLSAFCVYTAFLSANGMTEAFVYGVASSGGEVGRLGVAHTVTGGIFAVVAPLLVNKFGTIGLVAANCFAMSIRTCYSIYFAASFITQQSASKESIRTTATRLLGKMLPHPSVCVGFAVAFVVTYWSKCQSIGVPFNLQSNEYLILTGRHISVGLICVSTVAGLSYAIESKFYTSLKIMLRPKQD